MRTIAFRGKLKATGEWRYFTVSDNSAAAVTKRSFLRTVELGMFWRKVEVSEIDPETVGQYSDSLDLAGTPFCEGDIIQLETTHVREFRRVVGFRGGQFGYEPPREPGKWYALEGRAAAQSSARWTIIGNIHDNPELMK